MNRNSVHARVLVDELLRLGVTDLCLAPGSRSTPLVLAAARRAREGALRLRVFLDERSAAFFALGLGKATGRPAAVLTTSGTAVANLLPAVVEAAASETPLLLLTADRPIRLRGADANQVIEQRGIFGSYPTLELELAPPVVEEDALRHLRATAGRAVAAARGLPGGPVHLNVPYAKPLEPVDVPGDLPAGFPASVEPAWRGRDGGAPWSTVGVRRPRLNEAELSDLAEVLAGAQRPVVVAGPHPEASALGPGLRRLAAAWGAPLLADPLSGGRFAASGGGTVVAAYDLVLRDPEVAAALRPDAILRVGAAPTSAALLAWMDRHGEVLQVVVDAGRRWKDHQARAGTVVCACPVDTLARLAERLRPRGDAGWCSRWAAADRAAAAAALESDPHEGHIAAAVVETLPAGTPLFVSSSMPIRDVDAYGGQAPVDRPLFGNRGASGIDGIVSTALGVAAGTGRTTVALVGDLAFLHDVNGLLAAREADARTVFVVVNNDGGGIFHMLPVRGQEPDFTPYFATPHGARLAHGAALYGVPHRTVDPSDLREALAAALAAETSTVLEVRSERETNRVRHEESARRAGAAARAALDDAPPPPEPNP